LDLHSPRICKHQPIGCTSMKQSGKGQRWKRETIRKSSKAVSMKVCFLFVIVNLPLRDIHYSRLRYSMPSLCVRYR
jgi:hypothetical protein